MNVVAANVDMILGSDPGSIVLNVSDFLPDADGNWVAAAADLGSDTQASGEGVLVRITLRAVGTGVSSLQLASPIMVDGSASEYPLGNVLGGEIVIGDSCTSGILDSDSDGFTDGKEQYMTTLPALPCPQTATADDEAADAWPVDFNDDQTANILDIVQLTPPFFNTAQGDVEYSARKDLTADGAVNILDIVQLTPPVFNQTCAP